MLRHERRRQSKQPQDFLCPTRAARFLVIRAVADEHPVWLLACVSGALIFQAIDRLLARKATIQTRTCSRVGKQDAALAVRRSQQRASSGCGDGQKRSACLARYIARVLLFRAGDLRGECAAGRLSLACTASKQARVPAARQRRLVTVRIVLTATPEQALLHPLTGMLSARVQLSLFGDSFWALFTAPFVLTRCAPVPRCYQRWPAGKHQRLHGKDESLRNLP